MNLLLQLKSLLWRLAGGRYAWPAVDLTLPQHRRLHLVGSIHMGTPNMAPLPRQLLAHLRRSDALIVEADITQPGTSFGNTEQDTPLEQRIGAALWGKVELRADELGIPLSSLCWLPAWQAALVLQAHQAQLLGLRPEYGIDHQLLQAAHQHGINVQELEGTQSQIALLTNLPDGGLSLLEDTLVHWHTNARLLQQMVSWWLAAPPPSGPVTLPNTFGSSLYDVLMVQRNRAWHQQLSHLPAGRYMVAVGALHLYGEGNLPGMFGQ